MRTEIITYTDYNGNERTETHYFNLSKGEIVELGFATTGNSADFADMLQRIVDAKDGPAIYEWFTKILAKSYGVKSIDGKYMDKSPEHFTRFKQTEAYSELIVRITSDDEHASAFINDIIPKVPEETKPAIPAPPLK